MAQDGVVEDEDYCSGTDSESGSDYSVTQTQLAITDGPLEGDDASNPLVSRIGGRAAWLPTKRLPPAEVSQCSHCKQSMELLVQIFAPLDDSPYDRIVLVWGCARAPCQKAGQGCLKAIRILAHNARWEAKLQKKRQKQEKRAALKARLEEERKTRELQQEAKKKINPFAKAGSGQGFANGASVNAPLFSASDLLGNGIVTDTHVQCKAEEQKGLTRGEESEGEDDDDDDDDDLAEELAIKAAVDSTRASWTSEDWSVNAPAYLPAQYLNTFAEPSSSARAQDEQKHNKEQLQKLKQSGGAQELKGWEAETYGSMSAVGVDDVFERFVKRVGQHPRQVVRYEFGGQPLAFHARGKAYEALWPKKQGPKITSGQAFAGQDDKSSARAFTAKNVAACSRCGANRVCEMQLMPNLVNVLRPNLLAGGKDGEQAQQKALDAEAERKREIEEALGHKLPTQPDADGITRDSKAEVIVPSEGLARRTGLRWNTAIVLVCEADCHDKKDTEDSESWHEEVVMLQYENEQ